MKDPKAAAALKPYYPYGCKRPTFHDEYQPTFNRPNVQLVDTEPTGVIGINEHGVVHDEVEYPLDVLIYATGFQWMAASTFAMVRGRERALLEGEVERRGDQDLPEPRLPPRSERMNMGWGVIASVHRHADAPQAGEDRCHRLLCQKPD